MENSLFTDKFLAILSSERPNYKEICGHIIQTYNRATGDNIEERIGRDDNRLIPVIYWLNDFLASGDPNAHFFRKKAILLSVFSPELSSKASAVSQFYCPLCNGKDLISTINIRISPISYQASDSKTKRAFKKAISQRLYRSHHYGKLRLCVHIIFVIKRNRNNIDVDNMAKDSV